MTRHRVQTAAGTQAILPLETELIPPDRELVGGVAQVPISGRVYPVGPRTELFRPTEATVRTVVRGRTPVEARTQLAVVERQLRSAVRLYDGARYLPVARLKVMPAPTEGFAGLKFTLSATYYLTAPLWYLGPDDQRPRATPLESDQGLYVLGAAEIIGGGDDFVDLLPLDGVQLQSGTFTAPFSGITYEILEVNYDDID